MTDRLRHIPGEINVDRAKRIRRELTLAAAPRKDHCPSNLSIAGGHHFVKIAEEEEWQCTLCPERRDRAGQSIG